MMGKRQWRRKTQLLGIRALLSGGLTRSIRDLLSASDDLADTVLFGSGSSRLSHADSAYARSGRKQCPRALPPRRQAERPRSRTTQLPAAWLGTEKQSSGARAGGCVDVMAQIFFPPSERREWGEGAAEGDVGASLRNNATARSGDVLVSGAAGRQCVCVRLPLSPGRHGLFGI
ncbi:hypothetical protein MOSE0_E01926 [Monosporozyma servazzii]